MQGAKIKEQRVSEIWTSSVFRQVIVVQIPNGPDFRQRPKTDTKSVHLAAGLDHFIYILQIIVLYIYKTV